MTSNNPYRSIFLYGSRVYGTAKEDSDKDFILIKEDGEKEQFSHQMLFDVTYENTVYSIVEFQKLLDDHEISALECYFLPKEFRLKDSAIFSFVLDKAKLRHSLSKKSSNSWVKAKKKFEVEADRDIYAGKKSLFHSFRILDFGIQIATTGKINDYGSQNSLFKEIMRNTSEVWEDYQSLYKEKYNHLSTVFKKVAPK